MKNNKFCCLLLFVCFWACTIDYIPKKSELTEPDRLVVNCLLNPQKKIQIYLYSTCHTETGYFFRGIQHTQIKLSENGTVLYNAICPDSILTLERYPLQEATYKIEVSLPSYETVYAETTVPDTISSHFKEITSSQMHTIYQLSDFKGKYGLSSLYITAYTVHDNDTIEQFDVYFANNIILDKINRLNDADVVDEEIGSTYYEGYMRIKNKNISYIDTLNFIPRKENFFGDTTPPIYSEPNKIEIKVISASPEYDQYCTTYYQQISKIIYSDDLSGITYQPVQVFSNIKNGLGIFAGMNESSHYIKISNK